MSNELVLCSNHSDNFYKLFGPLEVPLEPLVRLEDPGGPFNNFDNFYKLAMGPPVVNKVQTPTKPMVVERPPVVYTICKNYLNSLCKDQVHWTLYTVGGPIYKL